MKIARVNSGLIKPVFGACFTLGLHALCLGADVCITNPGTGPDICVKWADGGPDPVHPTDFLVDFTDQAI